MQVWRLSRPEFARRLDGGGNRETAARWNSPGAGVVYTSRSLSLCALETIVHLPSARFVQGFVAARIEVPDNAGVEVVTPAEFPEDPLGQDAAAWFRQRGDRWLEASAALALVAPSVIVPQEQNVMLNPRHPRAGSIRIEEVMPFGFDARLFGSSTMT
ncbi:MAG TPA: RES family NAD+ phosphorylase [Geminicoccaceae bacterium]|jgi:RES domain-containing protein|nr:RES family NAD+ phosphorylase [Geminicoccaceae bacterium]